MPGPGVASRVQRSTHVHVRRFRFFIRYRGHTELPYLALVLLVGSSVVRMRMFAESGFA